MSQRLAIESAAGSLARQALAGPELEVIRRDAVKMLGALLDVEHVDVRLPEEPGRSAVVTLTGASRPLQPFEQVFVDDVAAVLTLAAARLRAEEEITRSSRQDWLTGMAGRDLLVDELGAALQSSADGALIGVVAVDVDRFGTLTDAFGRPFGDEIIRELARRLRDIVGGADAIGRISGSEFAVICPAIPDDAAATATAERVRTAFDAPFAVGEHRLLLTASVGIATGDRRGHTGASLLRDGEVALDRARSAGGARVVVFDQEMRRRLVEQVHMAQDLRFALDRQELTLMYQPLVDLQSGRVEAVEALLRWNHPRLGFIPPATFIPVAESTGLIAEIGRWVLAAACEQMARWIGDPAVDLSYVCVNVSAHELSDGDFPDAVARILRSTGVPAEAVALELTETVLIGETPANAEVLRRLDELGVRLVLDDFGTGYSSLNYVRKLPIEALKVDRSLIAEVAESERSRHIVTAIGQMARALDLRVTAEGVETAEQLSVVRELGCSTAQGYLLGRPSPPAGLEGLLRGPVAVPGMGSGLAGRAGVHQDTVSLGRAARELGVSVSTLRRWTNRGDVRVQRTKGGHRRIPVSEVQRLHSRQRDEETAGVLRSTPLPAAALPAFADLLELRGTELAELAARTTYVPGRPGWFGNGGADAEIKRWLQGLTAACRGGSYVGAIEGTRELDRAARFARATQAERSLFVERFSDVAMHHLRAAGADDATIVETRRLLRAVRHLTLEEPYAAR